MTTQKYSVTPHPVETILTWVKSGEIAIPEIQRPFVWEATKVRDFLDSLYKGFPVGYLITWKNPTVKLKDGSSSSGKKIMIDGQQRVTALMASILGKEVLTKDYKRTRIRIAFNPQTEEFEVSNPAIKKDASWFYDIADIFSPSAQLFEITKNYVAANGTTNENAVFGSLDKLRKIIFNHVGIIELVDGLDIDTVTEIFVRVNSTGVQLSQADFAMSKISVNEAYGGNTLRKAVDYFCHMAVYPDFHHDIQQLDPSFCATEYFPKMSWLRNEIDDTYDPKYTDILRVAFTTEFKRGRLQDLVALISGRNFETKEFEEAIVESSFKRLKESILNFMNEDNFKKFIMIIRSAGFVDSSLLGGQNNTNFAYIAYLTLRAQGMPQNEIERNVRRWFVYSMLTGRYSTGSPESVIDYDIRQIHTQGFESYAAGKYEGELSDAFWNASLPQDMDTSSSIAPYFKVFQAAQVKLGDLGFLSRDMSANDLITIKSDVHHLFPKDILKKAGMHKGLYNQIANYAIAQSEINIAIGNKEPSKYMGQVLEQCGGGAKKYGNIDNIDELKANLEQHCIPDGFEKMTIEDYPEFLLKRRVLMAQKMKKYFERL